MDYESYLERYERNQEWRRKGATLSDKTARQEFGLTQDEIYDAIEAGTLQYRLAAMSDDPDDLPQQIRDSVPPGQEQQIFDAMSRSPHPGAASVLSLIGRHHPDKRIAKAARRSAYRVASQPKRAR